MFDIISSFTSASLALYILLLVFRILRVRCSRYLPLPPGPKPLPILGNALDVPLSKQWLVFQRWAEEYGKYSRALRESRCHPAILGDIMYLNLLGQSVIVLNTAQATYDLLDKRSAIYSDRIKSSVVSL